MWPMGGQELCPFWYPKSAARCHRIEHAVVEDNMEGINECLHVAPCVGGACLAVKILANFLPHRACYNVGNAVGGKRGNPEVF